jgi:hypothetical protein
MSLSFVEAIFLNYNRHIARLQHSTYNVPELIGACCSGHITEGMSSLNPCRSNPAKLYNASPAEFSCSLPTIELPSLSDFKD